jgi:hypothetical protein
MTISQYIANENRAWGGFSTTSPGNPPNRKNRANNSQGRLNWKTERGYSQWNQSSRVFITNMFEEITQARITPGRIRVYEDDPGWFDNGDLPNWPKFEVYYTPKRGSAYWGEVTTLSMLNTEYYLQIRKNGAPASSRQSLFFKNSSRGDFSVGSPRRTSPLEDLPVGKLHTRLAYRGRGFVNDNYTSNLFTPEKELVVLPSAQTVTINRDSWHKFIQLPSQLLGFNVNYTTDFRGDPLPPSAFSEVTFVVNSSGDTQRRQVIEYDPETFQASNPNFPQLGRNLTTIGQRRLMDFFESLFITSTGQLVYRLKPGVTFPRGASAIIPVDPASQWWSNNHTYLMHLVMN